MPEISNMKLYSKSKIHGLGLDQLSRLIAQLSPSHLPKEITKDPGSFWPHHQKLHPYGDKTAAEPPALVLLFQTGERGEGKAKGKGQKAHASKNLERDLSEASIQ